MLTTYDDLLSLQLIRDYTKTDDNPGVTDDLLKLYRNAAFEAAEEYTGMNFSSAKTINEQAGRIHRRTGRIDLRYPLAQQEVTFYGGSLMSPVIVLGRIGEKHVLFPNGHPDRFYTIGDCANCGVETPLMVTYITGRSCHTGPVPNAILMGVLAYIAWKVENPGDVIMTTRNAQTAGASGLQGSNNAALLSGALDEWARVRKVVF